jgi:predicted phosphate transport protein (TIGR00153 family)
VVRLTNFIPQLLLPREDRFFGLLRSSTRNLHQTTVKLVEFLEHFDDPEAKAMEIKELEEVGDHIIHEIMTNLHRTFVTPFDREDIALLGQRLDDVVDMAEEVSRTMIEYQITKPTPRSIELAKILEESGVVLERTGDMLQSRGTSLRLILPLTVELNRLENQADEVHSKAVGELFANEKDPIEIIKWREIYGLLEAGTDRCEDAANVLEGIVLKNA